jgi:hypothetical protein
MNHKDQFIRKYDYMNHRLNLMKDGVHRMQNKDGEFGKGKMSEVIMRIKDYTNEIDQKYPPRDSFQNPINTKSYYRNKKSIRENKSGTKNDYSPKFMQTQGNSIDINQTMKIHRGFQNPGRESNLEGRTSTYRQKSINKARESYQKRMQRNKLSKMIRPYVKTPEPKMSNMYNDEFRKSIDMANRKYYQLKKQNPEQKKSPLSRQTYSHLIDNNRSKSFNIWKKNLYGISSIYI